MKALYFLLLAVSFLAPPADARQGGPFGLGVVLGDPTGLSMKYWTGKDHAVSGALAFNTGRHYYYHRDVYWDDNSLDIYLHANYLWHNFRAIPVERGALPLYWGVGGRMLLGDNFALGARGCGGIEFLPQAPIDIFLELGLVVDFLGYVGTDLDLGVGIRYFF